MTLTIFSRSHDLDWKMSLVCTVSANPLAWIRHWERGKKWKGLVTLTLFSRSHIKFFTQNSLPAPYLQNKMMYSDQTWSVMYRVQARGRLRRNTRPDGVNFALEGSGGEKTSPDIVAFVKSRYLYCQLYWKQNENENICHKRTWNFQITWRNTFKRCSDYFAV